VATSDLPETWRSELEWLEALPKVELHLHLEGAIPHPTLWELVCAHGGDPEVPTYQALLDRFAYRDFSHFIATWVWKNRFLSSYDDFTLIAEAVARDLASQRILYAEAFFSPADFKRHGLQTQRLAEAIRRGLDRVPGIEVALIADLVRDCGPEMAERTLAEVLETVELGVIGIGLGGSEAEYPPQLFSKVYERARGLGLHTTAHAGEAAGPASVWGAIRSLEVERIGHGVRSVEDPALVDYLAEHRIPLEVCPVSNLRTAVVPSLAEHPIRELFDRGVALSVSSDDPKMFDTSLAGEMLALERELGFQRDQIRQLILGAVECSWLADGKKARLAARLSADPAWGGSD